MGSCVFVCEDNAAGRLSTGLYTAAAARAYIYADDRVQVFGAGVYIQLHVGTTTTTEAAAAGTAADGKQWWAKPAAAHVAIDCAPDTVLAPTERSSRESFARFVQPLHFSVFTNTVPGHTHTHTHTHAHTHTPRGDKVAQNSLGSRSPPPHDPFTRLFNLNYIGTVRPLASFPEELRIKLCNPASPPL
jgi:hypothetical protein